MNKLTYARVIEENKQIKHKLKRAILAFLGGGSIALIGQGLYDVFFYLGNVNEKDSLTLMLVSIIFISALLTGLGLFDKIAQIFGAGSFIPISGFSNALTSAALESKSEGLIYGIGSNMFKLAGSVITYGIVSAYLLGIVKYLVLLIGGAI
jgi:stage V sporulation protein AC